jgi:YhcH/YjgK/YiaL family protein
MTDGKYEIDGDEVFALVQSYDTVERTEKRFESHRDYLDIQYVAEGREQILCSAVRALRPLTDYDKEKDFTLYADPEEPIILHLQEGDFAVFYPQDGHKPGCAAGASSRIKKVVVKVRI